MSTVKIATSPKITNPTLLAFQEKVQKQMELSIYQALGAAMNPSQSKYKAKKLVVRGKEFTGIGDVVAEYFLKLTKEEQNVAAKELGFLRGFRSDLKNAAAMAGVDLMAAKPVIEQVNLAREFSFINGQSITKNAIDMQVERFPWANFNNGLSPIDFTAVAAPVSARALRFNLHQVCCIDETGKAYQERGFWNHDEISLSAQTVNDKGALKAVAPFRVSNEFDDGECRPKVSTGVTAVLHQFALDTDFTPPKHFLVTLFMAEIDHGGFSEFLATAYAAVRSEIRKVLEDLGDKVGEFLETALGIDGAFAEKLGDIFAVIAMKILDWIVGTFVRWFKDDIFKPQDDHIALLVMESSAATFGGNLRSPIQTMNFRDHNGHYTVKYSWEIMR